MLRLMQKPAEAVDETGVGWGRLGVRRLGKAGEKASRSWGGRWGRWRLGGGRLGEAGEEAGLFSLIFG